MVSVDEVKAAFRLILGREAESDAVAAEHARACGSIDELRLALMGSEEFQANFRYNFLLNLPPPTDLRPSSERLAASLRPSDIVFLQTCDPHNYFGMLA